MTFEIYDTSVVAGGCNPDNDYCIEISSNDCLIESSGHDVSLLKSAMSLDSRIGKLDERVQEKIAQKNQEIDGYRETIKNLTEKQTKYVEKMAKASQTIQKRNNTIERQKNKIQTLSQDIETKESKVQTLDSEISTLRAKYNKLEGYTGNASDLIEALEKEIENLENEISDIASKSESLESDTPAMLVFKETIEKITNEIEELEKKYDKCQNSSCLKVFVAWLGAKAGICDSICDMMSQIDKDIEKKLKTIQGFHESSAAQKQLEIHKLQIEKGNKQKRIDELKLTLASYKTSPKYQVEQQIKVKKKKLTQLKEEIVQNKRTLELTEDKVEELEQECEELESQYEENQQALAVLQEELEEAQEELQNAQNALKEIASHLSGKITGETKGVVLGQMRERLATWQLFPLWCQPQCLTIEIDGIGEVQYSLEKFSKLVDSLQNEINIEVDNQKELARMEKLAVEGILSNHVHPFVDLPTRKHGEGGSFSVMYQICKNPKSRKLEVGGSSDYFAQQVATKIINQAFDEIQKSLNWSNDKRQSVELKVGFEFSNFVRDNPGKSAADYLNALTQIVRIARADGDKPKFSIEDYKELGRVLIRYGVEKGGNIAGLFRVSISISQALHEIDGQFGENWCESQLKDFLGAITTFCKENNSDYNMYISRVSFSTFTAGTNFIYAVKREIENVNARKQEADKMMESIVDGITNPNSCFDSNKMKWPRFYQLMKNFYNEPDVNNFQVEPKELQRLAGKIVDQALQKIGQEKNWSPDCIAHTRNLVVEKFCAFFNPNVKTTFTFNELFDRLLQLIRSMRIDSSILSPEALKELQDVTVLYGIGGPGVRNVINNVDLLNTVFNTMTISQAIDSLNKSGFFPEGLQLHNFLGAIQSFCNQNGLKFDQCLQDVPLKILINGTDFVNKCSQEIARVNALKLEAQQWIHWMAACTGSSNVVPVFLEVQGMPPNNMFDEKGIPSDNRPYVYFARLCDFCEHPLGELRDVSLYAMDDIQTGLQKTIPIVAELIIDCVHARANINQQVANAKKMEIMQVLSNFAKVNGDKLTYVNCLDQIAEVIRLAHGTLFALPLQFNGTNAQQELLSAFSTYAKNGGNLKELYQVPISQAIQILNNSGLFPNGINNQLRDFINKAMTNLFSNSTQLAGAFMRSASFSDLSCGITSFDGLMPKLPPTLNTPQIQQELLNVLVPYARSEKCRDLKALYQMPIAQAINVLQQAGCFQPGQGFPPPQLQNFLVGVKTWCNGDDLIANAFIKNASINDLVAGKSIAQVILPKLPLALNTEQIQQELLKALVPYAANGGNLKALYQMPMMQAVSVLQQTGCLPQGQGFPPPQLQNFLGGIHTACGGNDQNFYQFLNATSLSQLSTMQ